MPNQGGLVQLEKGILFPLRDSCYRAANSYRPVTVPVFIRRHHISWRKCPVVRSEIIVIASYFFDALGPLAPSHFRIDLKATTLTDSFQDFLDGVSARCKAATYTVQLRHRRNADIQDAAEITPTFQRGITNKWYEISPKTFYFPNVDIKKFFFTLGFKNYIVQMVAVTTDTHLEPFFLNGLL
jgi:hypothetical protein